MTPSGDFLATFCGNFPLKRDGTTGSPRPTHPIIHSIDNLTLSNSCLRALVSNLIVFSVKKKRSTLIQSVLRQNGGWVYIWSELCCQGPYWLTWSWSQSPTRTPVTLHGRYSEIQPIASRFSGTCHFSRQSRIWRVNISASVSDQLEQQQKQSRARRRDGNGWADRLNPGQLKRL